MREQKWIGIILIVGGLVLLYFLLEVKLFDLENFVFNICQKVGLIFGTILIIAGICLFFMRNNE